MTPSLHLRFVLAGALLVSLPLSPVHAQIPAAAAGASAPITVTVDGRPVNFAGSPPQSVGGRLLVPLRAIFEALGATVDFSGGAVRAQRGPTQLQLQIGSTQASVNGQNRSLDVPAQAIFGRTFVPLRFVGEALGAGVDFNTATQTVTISSPDGASNGATNTGATSNGATNTGATTASPTQGNTNANPNPTNLGNTNTAPYQAPNAAQSVTGTLVRVDGSNAVAMSVNGQIRTFQLNQGALVLRQNSIASSASAAPVRQPTRPTTLSTLVPGESVRVVLDTANRASQLSVLTTVVLARVQYGAGNQIILDDANDTTLTIGPNLSYTDGSGKNSATANLNAGQTVALFLSPQNRTIYRVSSDSRDTTIQNATGATDPLLNGGLPPAGAPSIGLVQTNATAPLKAGASLVVTARATTGQRLTWSLGTKIQNQPITEDLQQAGVYRGTYTVKAGDDVLDARVSVRVPGPNGFEATAQSEEAVTIDTVAPRLVGTFPANGASISVAQPNIAIFADDLGGSGLGSATVSVVSGETTTPIPATVAPPTSVNAVPPQPLSGRIQVRAFVSDKAGNSLPVNFSFTIAQNAATAGAIASFTQGANRALAPSESLPLQLVAAQGGRASFDVLDARGTAVARDLPMSEDGDLPGTYRATYRVPNEATGQLRFVGKFDAGDGQTNQQEATAPVSLVAATPAQLTISSPTDDATGIGSSLVVSGRAAPGATVNVSVSASGTRFFVLQYNDDLGTVQARADATGNWKTAPIAVARPKNVQGLTLSISATQTDAANQTSAPVTISVSP